MDFFKQKKSYILFLASVFPEDCPNEEDILQSLSTTICDDSDSSESIADSEPRNLEYPSQIESEASSAPLESNILQSERFRAQIEATEPLKKQLWQQTVKAKITNQASVLKNRDIPNNLLTNLAQSVKSGDADNCEAVAAAYYWKHLFPPAWQFYRKRDGLPPNNLLNYAEIFA